MKFDEGNLTRNSSNYKKNMSSNIEDTQLFAEQYFSFLVTKFGFDKPIEEWVSYEFHIKYHKETITIDIAVEADGASMPWVSFKDHSTTTELDMTLTPTNYYYIESLEDNTTIKNIHCARNERYNPKVTKFVNEYEDGNYSKTHAGLDADYATWGKQELETLLRESAAIIKRHPQILQGDLTDFPKREQPKDIRIEIYEQTNNGVKKQKKQKFTSIFELFQFIIGKKSYKK